MRVNGSLSSSKCLYTFDDVSFYAKRSSQPCLHNSNNSPKNRCRDPKSTSTENHKRTAAAHYTAYGYLADTPASDSSTKLTKGGSAFPNRWWMHVDAEEQVDYAPHRLGSKMWRKRIPDSKIVRLAVRAFSAVCVSVNQQRCISGTIPNLNVSLESETLAPCQYTLTSLFALYSILLILSLSCCVIQFGYASYALCNINISAFDIVHNQIISPS